MRMDRWTITAVALLMLAGCTSANQDASRDAVVSAEATQAPVPGGAAMADDDVDETGSPKVEVADHATPAAHGATLQGEANKPVSRYLPTEQRLMRQDGIALETVMPLIASTHFDQSINALARESSRDAEAQQLTRLYVQEATRSLQGKGQLAGLSCGLSVCMGAVRMSSKDAASEWSNAFADRRSAPSYSFVSDIRQIGAGQYESRFVFSTDPASNSLTGVVQPGRK